MRVRGGHLSSCHHAIEGQVYRPLRERLWSLLLIAQVDLSVDHPRVFQLFALPFQSLEVRLLLFCNGRNLRLDVAARFMLADLSVLDRLPT